MRISVVLLSLVLLPAAFAASPKMKNGFCIEEMEKQMDRVGLGNPDRPFSGVEKELVQGQFWRFARQGTDHAFIAVAIQKLHNLNKQKLFVEVPSLFDRRDQMEFLFNDKCELESVDVVRGSTAAHLDAERCKQIMDDHRKSVAATMGNNLVENSLKGAYPKHSWAQCDNIYSEAVVNTCKKYEKQLVSTRQGAAAVEEEKKSGSSAE